MRISYSEAWRLLKILTRIFLTIDLDLVCDLHTCIHLMDLPLLPLHLYHKAGLILFLAISFF